MKTGTMKLAVGAAVALAAAAGVRAEETGSAGGGGTLSQDLQEGLQRLHAGNQAEVQLGTLAQQSAGSSQV